MSIKLTILDLVFKTLEKTLGLIFSDRRQNMIKALVAERIAPTFSQPTKHGSVKFFCPGSMAMWRAETLMTKEPETLEWIDSFGKQELLWDIGANMGCYSMFAAQRGIKVLAFEPSAFNYYLLCKNIEINDLSETVYAYCLALSDVNELGVLNMTNTELGGAINEFGSELNKVEIADQTRKVIFRQGMIGRTIDDLITSSGFSVPNHIKIDVDGIEQKIIHGARETLRRQEVKSILIELDEKQTDYIRDVSEIMESSGLEMSQKRHSEMIEDSQFSSTYNYIFRRTVT
jgi:FkbM family methyltransferase